MFILKKGISIFFVLTAALFFVPGMKIVFASGGSNCDFKSKLDALQSFQDNPLPDYLENLKRELSLRKEILRDVLSCSLADAQNLKTSLDQLSPADAESQNIQKNFSSRLGDVINYYNFQNSRIDDLGIQGSKNFSRELETWRSGNYLPLSATVANFVILVKNNSLINSAQERFNRIGAFVNGLKLGDNEDIKSALETARGDLDQALRDSNAAKESFHNNGQPDDSPGFVKSSLESLSKTYQDFFKIREVLSKIIPSL